MIYFVILILLLLLSYYYDIRDYKRRKTIWYNMVLVLLILFVSLRYRIGGDSIAYLYAYYNSVPTFEEFSSYDVHYYEPLYLLLNTTVKSFGGKFYIVQFIHAIIVNVLIFKYFKKHCQYIFLCLLIYYVWIYALFNCEIMRASLSVVICLFGTDSIIEKKWIKGYFLYFVGIGFHLSAVVMLIVPFLLFFRANRFGYYTLCFSYFFGIWLAAHLGDAISKFDFINDTPTSHKLDVYMNSGDFNTSFNIQGLLLHTLPSLLYPIISLYYAKKGKNDKSISYLQLEPLIMIGLILSVMTTSVLLMYRINYFFIIYLIISYAELIKHILSIMSRKGISIFFTLLILLPFINIATSYYRAIVYRNQSTIIYNYKKYIPYSTIFDRTKDPIREKVWGDYFQTSDEEY